MSTRIGCGPKASIISRNCFATGPTEPTLREAPTGKRGLTIRFRCAL